MVVVVAQVYTYISCCSIFLTSKSLSLFCLGDLSHGATRSRRTVPCIISRGFLGPVGEYICPGTSCEQEIGLTACCTRLASGRLSCC